MAFFGEQGISQAPGDGEDELQPEEVADVDAVDVEGGEGLDPRGAYPQLHAFDGQADPLAAFDALPEGDKQRLLEASRREQEEGPHLG